MTAWAVMWSSVAPQQRAHVRMLLEPRNPASYYMPTDTFPIPWEKCRTKITVWLTCLRDERRSVEVILNRRLGNNILAPSCKLKSEKIKAVSQDKVLADDGFHVPYPCSIILGSDVAGRIYRGLPQSEGELPFAQDTVFGWSFFGEMEKDTTEEDE